MKTNVLLLFVLLFGNLLILCLKNIPYLNLSRKLPQINASKMKKVTILVAVHANMHKIQYVFTFNIFKVSIHFIYITSHINVMYNG